MTVGHGNVRVTEVWQKLSDFAIMRLSFISVLRFSLRDQDKEGKMRKEGNVQWGDSQGVIRLLSEWDERQC